jgi:glycerol-3-phosphate acyltransferase PlsX
MENVVGIKNPRVALFNIGAEEEKGNALVKETYPLLKELDTINFVGNIEARDIPAGEADVVVCDAFTGNAILKMYEGVAGVLLKEIKGAIMSTTASKIGGLLIKPALKKTLKKFEEMGCDFIQGYYFSRPLPKDQFIAFVKGKNKTDGDK